MRLLQIGLLPVLTRAFTFYPIPASSAVGTRLWLKSISANKDTQVDRPHFDMDRLVRCIDDVGECSIEEIDLLRSDLHNARLENLVITGSGVIDRSEDGFLHRLFEDELDMQLAMLRKETPESTLFVEQPDGILNMPGPGSLEKEEISNDRAQPFRNVLKTAEVEIANEEVLLGHNTESVAEALVICGALIAFFVAPSTF